jgi:uncharacterized protein YdcH (DUF465 family)
LAISFPDQLEAIKMLRDADSSVDEICRDYELIASDLETLTSRPAVADPEQIKHLRTTLTGLRDELAERLEGTH